MIAEPVEQPPDVRKPSRPGRAAGAARGISGMNEVRDPCSASMDHRATRGSAMCESRRRAAARGRARAPPPMNWVPLISDRPSFASSTIGSRPTTYQRLEPRQALRRRRRPPLPPTSGRARCGERCQVARTRRLIRRAGTDGQHAAVSGKQASRLDGRDNARPEVPFASVVRAQEPSRRARSRRRTAPPRRTHASGAAAAGAPRSALAGIERFDEAPEAGVDARTCARSFPCAAPLPTRRARAAAPSSPWRRPSARRAAPLDGDGPHVGDAQILAGGGPIAVPCATRRV